jgi:hypothetical protein
MLEVCQTPATLVQFFFAKASLSPECLWALLVGPRPRSTTLGEYALVYFFTCLIEFPFYWLGLRNRCGLVKIAWVTLVLNLATHPLIYFLFPLLVFRLHGGSYQSLLASEVFAPVVEAMLLYGITRLNVITVVASSVVANLCSWWIGAYFVQLIAIPV